MNDEIAAPKSVSAQGHKPGTLSAAISYSSTDLDSVTRSWPLCLAIDGPPRIAGHATSAKRTHVPRWNLWGILFIAGDTLAGQNTKGGFLPTRRASSAYQNGTMRALLVRSLCSNSAPEAII